MQLENRAPVRLGLGLRLSVTRKVMEAGVGSATPDGETACTEKVWNSPLSSFVGTEKGEEQEAGSAPPTEQAKVEPGMVEVKAKPGVRSRVFGPDASFFFFIRAVARMAAAEALVRNGPAVMVVSGAGPDRGRDRGRRAAERHLLLHQR